MKTLLALLISLSHILSACSQTPVKENTAETSRKAFLRAAAAHLKISEKKLDIFPASSNPAEADLQIGDLHAWHVWKKKGGRVLAGFSSGGADGAIAFDGYQEGITALLKACQIHDSKKRPSAEQIARRVAFCLGNPTKAEILFDKVVYDASGFTPPDGVVPPVLIPQKSGQLLTYITMTPGNTGTWDLSKVSVTILPDYKTIITREPLR